MFKNISFNQITLFLGALMAILNALIFTGMFYFRNIFHDSLALWIAILILSAVISFFIIRFILERFIFRKIKLIYKIINDSKKNPLPSKDSIEDKLANTFEAVNKDVVEWTQKKDKEIRTLTELENYRRNFLGNVSHELKTPIFSIQGYIHTLLDGGLYDEKINRKYLLRAASNVERLENIVEDLEVIHRLESGKIVLNKKSFDLRELADEVIADVSFLAEEKKIDLDFKEGAGKSFDVYADRENIRQVLSNLVINGIKYNKSKGFVKMGFYDMEDQVLIEVSDNGIGIEEEHLKFVFDRFYRVDTGRSRKQGGSGLGLAIVKHIIEAHNQNINVRSSLGVGTTFGFTLTKSGKVKRK